MLRILNKFDGDMIVLVACGSDDTTADPLVQVEYPVGIIVGSAFHHSVIILSGRLLSHDKYSVTRYVFLLRPGVNSHGTVV